MKRSKTQFVLSADLASAISLRTTPSNEETSTMLKEIMAKRDWSHGILALILCTEIETLKAIRDTPLAAVIAPQLRRLIWIVYTLDTEPAILFDAVNLISWGKSEKQRYANRAKADIPVERQEQIIEALETMTEQKTASELSIQFEVQKDLLYKLCRIARYRCAEPIKRQKLPPWMEENPFVFKVDWRNDDISIAGEFNKEPLEIERLRFLFIGMEPARLLKILSLRGIAPERFAPVIVK